MLELIITALIAAPAAYIIATTFESFFHDQILDISAARARFYFRIRKLAPGFWNTHVAHGVLHHHKTFRQSYTRQFTDEYERERLIARLQSKFTAEDIKDFKKCSFGNTFTHKGFIFYALPMYLPPLATAPFLTPDKMIVVAVIFFLFASPFFIFSKWIHPHMHKRYLDAMVEAPIWTKWILKSKYGLAIRISHWVHHADPAYNFNLQYGADLVRGRFRAPTSSEYDLMVADGVITKDHRDAFEGRRFLLHSF